VKKKLDYTLASSQCASPVRYVLQKPLTLNTLEEQKPLFIVTAYLPVFLKVIDQQKLNTIGTPTRLNVLHGHEKRKKK